MQCHKHHISAPDQKFGKDSTAELGQKMKKKLRKNTMVGIFDTQINLIQQYEQRGVKISNFQISKLDFNSPDGILKLTKSY